MAARISLALVTWFLLSSTSSAQEFKEWQSRQDLFIANFPGEPVVTNVPWETEYGAKLQARVYTATIRGPRTYSVTAVDYGPVEDLLKAKAKACPDQADERCTGHTSFSGAGYWKNDLRGAMLYAAKKFLVSDIKLTSIAWNYLGDQAIEANELQFTNNKDKSRSFVTIYMHHNRLYVMQETTPANYPPPGLFVQSMYLLEPNGRRANHERVYFNGPEIDPIELNEFQRGPNDEFGFRPGATRGSQRKQ